MTNKQIKDFYLSLIDNKEAEWSMEKVYDDSTHWETYTCQIGDIRIVGLPKHKLVFKHGVNRWQSTQSDIISFKDIGISKFRLIFPFFGIEDQIARRIKKDNKNKNKKESSYKLKSVAKVLMNDKALLRDMKLKQLEIE